LATDSGAGSNLISVHFSKMQGLGNDFVMISDSQLACLAAAVGKITAGEGRGGPWLKQFCSKLASTLCNRHFGIGGDGLIVAIDLARLQKECADKNPADDNRAREIDPFYVALEEFTASYPQRNTCDLGWIYVNADGSYSAMCGNGLRCFTLFAQELGWLRGAACRVATAAYPVVVTIKNDGVAGCTAPGGGGPNALDACRGIEVISRLAGPKFAPQDIPLDTSMLAAGLTTFVDQLIDVNGLKLQATCVSMGNPHCVIFEQDGLSLAQYAADIKSAHAGGHALQNFPRRLLVLAADIQQLSLFPEGVNVAFVKIDPETKGTALAFVVERGCGATLACASGAAAVLAAGVISGRLNKKSYVILPGGKLEVSLSSVPDQENMQEFIDLTGPAVKVFSGDITLPAAAFRTEVARGLKSGEGLCV
jgi:diaminopimelate epimerase